MKLSKFWKVIIGIVTAWEVLAPLLFVATWFAMVAMIATAANNNQYPEETVIPAFFIPFVFLIICNSFLQLGLKIFYLAHVILNRAGNDGLRVMFGILIFLFSFIAMPVYYFIYILPENPPSWALTSKTAQPSSTSPSEWKPIDPEP
jgi:hypothetical protein